MKKNALRYLYSAAALVLALAAGCDSAPVRQPKFTQECVLNPKRQAADVNIAIQSAVHVVLPGPEAGSGLVWEIASNNTKVLEQEGPLKANPEKGITSVSFYSLKPGKSVLRFVLVQTGQQETVPAAICEVTVRVKY